MACNAITNMKVCATHTEKGKRRRILSVLHKYSPLLFDTRLIDKKSPEMFVDFEL